MRARSESQGVVFAGRVSPMGKGGDHGGVVNAIFLSRQAHVNSVLSAEHFLLGAQVAVGSDSAAHEERCGAFVLCFESLKCAMEHVHDLIDRG